MEFVIIYIAFLNIYFIIKNYELLLNIFFLTSDIQPFFSYFYAFDKSNNISGNSILFSPYIQFADIFITYKNFKNGFVRSSLKSNSLWSISSGNNNYHGALTFLNNYFECEKGIKLSCYPWIINVGQITYFILYKFKNRYSTIYLPSQNVRLYTTPLIDVYADINIKHQGFRKADK